MLKSVLMTMCVVAMSATTFAAQARPAQTAPAAKPVEVKPEPAQKPAAEPAALPVNIKIEVSITDQTGNNPAAKKVVTMIAGDRQSTNVRSSASVPVKQTVFKPTTTGANASETVASYSYRNVTINVDARPIILAKEPTKISVSFGLEYLPKTAGTQEEMEPGMTSWSERLSLILESGKPMIVSQAADPTSDRKITVEVTATILK